MPIDFQPALGNHELALRVRSYRTEVIAGNLANADTPGYKARDIDFRQILQGERERLPLRTTDPSHLSPPSVTPFGEALKYRVPTQPSLDGNTVDPSLEQAAYGENAVRYQATLRFLGGKFKGLMTAIRGE